MSVYTFHGYKCIANDEHRLIKGGPKPRSFATLISLTRQGNQARSSPFAHSLRSIANSLLFARFPIFGPRRHIRGSHPIPVFARSS